MKKQPLFDVSRFNCIADKYGIPWIDRIPLIETVCWGSKGWIDSALAARIDGKYRAFFHALDVERANPQPVVRGSKVGIKRVKSHRACAAA